MTIEFRVRPVTRYIITRFHQDDDGRAGVEGCGEFTNVANANRVCEGLASLEEDVKFFLAPIHDSSCAVHNMPAYPEGQCDCSARGENELVD